MISQLKDEPICDILEKYNVSFSFVGTDQKGRNYFHAQINESFVAWFLKTMRRNRNPHEHKIAGIARDLEQGNFRDLGDPFRFDKNLKGFDGQHRALALTLAAKENPAITMPVLIVTNYDLDDYKFTDNITQRQSSDDFRTRNFAYVHELAAACKLIISFFEVGDFTTFGKAVATRAEIEKLTNDYPNIIEFANMYGKRKIVSCLPKTWLTTMHFLFSLVEQHKADHFMRQILDHEGMHQGSPALAFDHWFHKTGNKHPYRIIASTMASTFLDSIAEKTVSRCVLRSKMPILPIQK